SRPHANGPAPGGRITFGSKNTQDCSSKWVTLNADNVDWNLQIARMNVGSKCIVGGLETAQMSTASPLLVVPSIDTYFRDLMKVLGGQFDDDVDLYTVDCGKVGSLPAIDITLGSGFGLTYSVPPQDYIVQINSHPGAKCALLIVQGDDNWFVVGTQFFPKRCVHLDYYNEQISFADPLN
ncbi:aspartic protease 7, partial [Aphelenchoides avenae]